MTSDIECFAFKPQHKDGECCWCDHLHDLFDEGYYDYLYRSKSHDI